MGGLWGPQRISGGCVGDAWGDLRGLEIALWRGLGALGNLWRNLGGSKGSLEGSQPGKELGTETPSGHARSDAYPNSPLRKEWEALTRFSASAISWTASRSFPALSMSPAAATTASSAGRGASSPPDPRRGGERRRGALCLPGFVVPGLPWRPGCATHQLQFPAGLRVGGVGSPLADRRHRWFPNGDPKPW